MNSSDHHLPGRLARFVAKLNALLETEPDENTLISLVSCVWGPGQTMPIHDHVDGRR